MNSGVVHMVYIVFLILFHMQLFIGYYIYEISNLSCYNSCMWLSNVKRHVLAVLLDVY